MAEVAAHVLPTLAPEPGDQAANFPEVRLTLRSSARFPDLTARLGLHPMAEGFPRLRRWVDRIESLPGYDQTFPAHWNEPPFATLKAETRGVTIKTLVPP
ncbi:MAG TPA: hypothetical protein VJV79_12770 [Polyangiaceae bacterium]|nr:hypothetical protein [Polyangiaceae bacterium]